MAYERRSPDYSAFVRRVAEQYPREWEAARKRPDGTRDPVFIRRVAWELHKTDANVGLNGKRGGEEISTDALAYRNPTAPGGAEVIDVIIGATHAPAWQDVTQEGVLGRYIQPTDPGGSVPPPPEPPVEDALEARVSSLELNCQRTATLAQQNAVRIENLARTVTRIEQKLGTPEQSGVMAEIAAVREEMGRLVVKGQTAGRSGLFGIGAHYHDVNLPVSTLPPKERRG